MKIVINKCWGGFGVSAAGIKRYSEVSGIELYPFTMDDNDVCTPITWEETLLVKPYNIHYSTKPIVNGKDDDDSYWYHRGIKREDDNLVRVV